MTSNYIYQQEVLGNVHKSIFNCNKIPYMFFMGLIPSNNKNVYLYRTSLLLVFHLGYSQSLLGLLMFLTLFVGFMEAIKSCRL